MLLVEKVRNALVVLANEQSGPLRLVFVIPLGQKMVPVDTQQEFLAPSCTHCSSKKVKCDRLSPCSKFFTSDGDEFSNATRQFKQNATNAPLTR